MHLKCSLFSQLYFIFLIGLIQNPGFVYFPFHIYQDEETLQIPNTEKLELLKKNTDSGISKHVSLPVKKINLDNDTTYTSMKTRKEWSKHIPRK